MILAEISDRLENKKRKSCLITPSQDNEEVIKDFNTPKKSKLTIESQDKSLENKIFFPSSIHVHQTNLDSYIKKYSRGSTKSLGDTPENRSQPSGKIPIEECIIKELETA